MSSSGHDSSSPTIGVLLCHNSLDKPIVQRLDKLLGANGVKTWIDERDLPAGRSWLQSLGDALTGSPVALICLGPHDVGPWQKDEIEILVQERKKAGKVVIPLILPTCVDQEPSVPPWLSTAQLIDLRRDADDIDPFGKLLSSIDSRDAAGHFRPSVLVLRNAGESTSNDAFRRVVSESSNVLQRIRVMDYDSETLLESRLRTALRQTDVLVSLLATDSYDPQPGDLFRDGFAAGAKRLAEEADVQVIQWRSDSMKLPDDPKVADRFRTTDTDTSMPQKLGKYVADECERRYAQRLAVAKARKDVTGKCRTVLGYPIKEKRFVRQVTERLENREIECESPPKWDFVLDLLKRNPPLYDAVVVVFSGDDDWLCDSTVALRKLRDTLGGPLPAVRAFLHKADDRLDADPIPIRLKEFEEYYGLGDLARLAEKIVSTGGHQT